MPRISKNDVNKALDHAAKVMMDAGGADKRISRAEIQKALGSLEGTEKKLVDVFFKFVDHRDFKKGATVTHSDIQRAIAYAKDRMVAKYDLNSNGLSKAEISKMSLSGKLAVDLAKALKAATVDPTPTGFFRPGDTFYSFQERTKATSEKRLTSADTSSIDATLKAQILAATQGSYDSKTLADAFNDVDDGEFVVTQFHDEATGKKYTAIDFGAGDNTYGAIFEAGKTKPIIGIHDGDFEFKK